jgi:hypothetical protein
MVSPTVKHFRLVSRLAHTYTYIVDRDSSPTQVLLVPFPGDRATPHTLNRWLSEDCFAEQSSHQPNIVGWVLMWFNMILWMEEILHQMVTIGNYETLYYK